MRQLKEEHPKVRTAIPLLLTALLYLTLLSFIFPTAGCFLWSASPEEEDGGKDKKEEDISAEDKALQEGLELAVGRATDPDHDVQKLALEHLRTEIRAATSSMTSVPKPLKFLRPHYATLKEVRYAWYAFTRCISTTVFLSH